MQAQDDRVKVRRIRRPRWRMALALAAAGPAMLATSAFATDGTWTSTTSGNWSDIANWNLGAGPIADGAGSTADFSTLDLTADTTVTLDTPRTIGNLIFGDTDPSTGANWIIGNGANSANILTLDGGTPTITVNALGTGDVARIDAQINASTLGFTKAGAGTLVISNTANTGAIVVSGGTLTGGDTGASNAGLGTGQITLQNGATLNTLTSSGNTWTMANALVVGAGQTATLDGSNRMRFNGAVSGSGTLDFNVNTTVGRQDLQNDWSGFTGNLNLAGSGTIRLGINGLASGQPRFNSAGWASSNLDLEGAVQIAPNTNSGGNTISIGALSGASANAALAAHTAGAAATWSVGGLNTNTSFAGSIHGTENFTKIGTGTLVLTNTAIDTAGTFNINAGVLQVDGAKTNTGTVFVNGGGTLSGNGSVAGVTTIEAGGHIAAGTTSSVGTLTVPSLTLDSGSFIDSEFNATGNDLIDTSAGALTIDGGSINLYNEGTTNAFSTNGTYNLIKYAGSIGGTGLGALAVNNPQSGKSYNFGTDGTFVQLTISSGAAPIYWNVSTGGSWATGTNWTGNAAPNTQGAFAGFGGGGTAISAPSTITLDGDKTVGTISFNSGNAFTIAQGTGGSLILDNASTPASLTDGNGSHIISAPVTLTATGVDANIVNPTDSVTISGAITGSGEVSNVGAGTLVLSGNNTGYTGIASAAAGQLQLDNANALAAATLAGGAGTIGFGSNATYNVAALGSGVITTANAATLAVGGDGSSATFAGSLAGPATLAKNGAGTFTLSGISTQTGGLVINGGTVQVENNETYTGGTTVNNGATLAIDSGASVAGDINLSNGGTFSMLATGSGSSPSIFPGNNLNLATGATATINSLGLGNGYSGAVTGDATSTLVVSGHVSFNTGSSQQLANMLGTVDIPAGAEMRFSSNPLANGGSSTSFQVDGSLETRIGGAVALGALSGTGLVQGPIGSTGNVTYTIGEANTSTTFSGTIQDGTAADRTTSINKAGTGTLTLSGPLTYTGTTSVSGGTLALQQSLTTSSSVSATAGTLQLTSDGTNNKVIVTPSVTTSGTGLIDLNDNKMVVTTAGATGTWDPIAGAYNGVSGMVASARNGGNWNGATGITSSLASTGGSNLYTLGVAKVGDIQQIADTDTTTVAGQTVHGSDTLVMYTYGGDANLDGKINIDDYGRIDGNVGQSGSVFGWYNGDFNYDGKINIDDYGIIDGNIGLQGAPIPTVASAGAVDGVSAVPEPASLGLIALAGAGLLGRRRRRDASF